MTKAADRVGAGAFGSLGRQPRSERGRAKAQAEGAIPEYELLRLDLSKVDPCPMNPRRNYGTEEQSEALGQSLAKKQTTACVVVTREAYLRLWPAHERITSGDSEYVLLNGERRYRAARQVGLEALDCVVRDDLATSRADFMDYLMIENEDREDFDLIERARGLEQLLAACDGNAAEVARRRGRDRSWVGNQIALLTLPFAIQQRLATGEMAERYGRRLARAFKDDRSLTADDLLALEERLKSEERAKRDAVREAARMLSADNIATSAAETVEQVATAPVLSADNTARTVAPDDTPTAQPPRPAPHENMLSADNTARTTGPAALPHQSAPVQGHGTTTPAQLVRALGETADEQAATLRAGLDVEAFHALVEVLHSQV